MMSQLFRLIFHFLVKEESGASVNDKVEQGENPSSDIGICEITRGRSPDGQLDDESRKIEQRCYYIVSIFNG